MKLHLSKRVMFLGMCGGLILSAMQANAFALLGPFESWMEETNGLRQPGDIGGPMDITNEYRWNVPVVTYGFDQSFLDYFGTNGVMAVKSAIQILNELPRASQLVLTNYPFDSRQRKVAAQQLNDLKSWVLKLFLEQMGLAEPTRSIFVLRQWSPGFIPVPPNALSFEWDWEGWAFPDFIAERNFDPLTLNASHNVNDTFYSAEMLSYGNKNDIVPFAVDPSDSTYTAVADFEGQMFERFYTGLTFDDVGGLAYLLSTNNANYETLLPGIVGVGTNANSFVNGAWRPGIDKVTFVSQPMDSLTGEFLPMTNQFTDLYITNGILLQQQVARVVLQPDFLFSVADLGKDNIITGWLVRTGTTSWINNSALNGNPGGAGPGVIQPPIKFVFNNQGREMFSFVGLDGNTDESAEDLTSPWGTFDDSTNTPILYPVTKAGTNQMTVRMWLTMGSSNNDLYANDFRRSFEWSKASMAGTQYHFQTSTNLTDWITLFAVTNNGTVNTYFVNNPLSVCRFYRLVPQ